MKYSVLSFRPYGLEETILSLCKLYHGEDCNPYEVDSPDYNERMLQFFKYNIYDAERSLSENTAHWKYLLMQEKGGSFSSEDTLAKALYRYAMEKKLSAMKEMTGCDFREMWERLSGGK